MTDDPVSEYLEHFGVKGMKWGVRKDKKWQKNIYSVRGALAVHNAVADKMNNGGIEQLNNMPKYKNAKQQLISDRTGEPVNALGRQYVKDYEKLNEKFTREAISEVHGVSPSGQFKATLDTSNPQWRVKISRTDVQHADVVLPDIVIDVDHDENGYITSMSMIKDSVSSMAQDATNDAIKEHLAHYGVKGMKWGIRRKRGSDGRVKGHKMSVDARTTRSLRGRPAASLTNMQLKKINERMQLEQKFSQMNPTRKDRGKAFANEVLKGTVGAAGSAAVVKLATDPKNRARIERGIKVVKFRTSPEGRLLRRVTRGDFG